MIDKVLKTIKKYHMINKNDRIVVGVSGGPDSLCLLNILNDIKNDYDLRLYVVHINHMLRGIDADRDAKFVEVTCKGMGIPFFLFTINVKKYAHTRGLSEEAAGRKIRYKKFFDVAKELGANKIAVAHNKNDLAETVLLNILRGTGTTGLIGIKPVNGILIRPLIAVSRSEIIQYLESKDLKPVIDRTNYIDIYKRNRVRLKLIPFIEENFNIDIIENLYRTSIIISDDDDYLTNQSEIAFKKASSSTHGEIRININDIKMMPDSLKRRVIRIAYKNLKGDINNLTYCHIADVLSLINKQTSSKIDLPFEIEVIKSYNELIFRKKKNYKKDKKELKLNIPGITNDKKFGHFETSIIDANELENLDIDKNIKFFDLDKIDGDVFIRYRKVGDIIAPLNMNGTKKLKKFFIDEKIPLEIRDKVPLLAIGNNILWIIGYRMSDHYKVDGKTKKVLLIKYNRKG